MNEQELKQKLKTNPNVSLTTAMLYHIGSPDPELRDGLIYPQFVNFILQNEYSIEQVESILNQCLDNLTDEKVFKRSFSVLVIAVILHKHEFNSEKLSSVTTKLSSYIKEEQDLRGYVEGQGWVHSIAHGADAISELSNQVDLAKTDLENLFYVINEKMYYDQGVFSADEDERAAVAVNTILKNRLDFEVFKKAINEVKETLIKQMPLGKQQYFNSRMNYKAFLRSLYFILKEKNADKHIIIFLEQTIIEISHVYY